MALINPYGTQGENQGMQTIDYKSPSGAVDPFGNASRWANNDPSSQATETAGGFTTGGAAANIGGSMGGYQNLYGQQQGLGAGYRGQANEQYGQSQDVRGQQLSALDLERQAALGQAPSVAAIQQQQGLQQALASQQAMAASARGAAGIAGAQYNAAQNAAALQQQGIGQAAMLRAQEMANARNAYMAGASGIRGMDLSAYQNAGQMGLGYNQQMLDLARAQQQAQAQGAQLRQQYWSGQTKADTEAAGRPLEFATGVMGMGAGLGMAALKGGK